MQTKALNARMTSASVSLSELLLEIASLPLSSVPALESGDAVADLRDSADAVCVLRRFGTLARPPLVPRDEGRFRLRRPGRGMLDPHWARSTSSCWRPPAATKARSIST